MPAAPPSQSRTTTSATPVRSTAAGTGAHVVDRALAVHTLLAAGRTPANVQRRLGKSKGYVSVLGYLGAALAGLEPDDRARLRSPAVTPRVVWALVTQARTEERVALKQALGDGLYDSAREDARRQVRARATIALRSALRAHTQAAAAGLAAPPKARGGRRPRATGVISGAFAWNPAAWAADPVAYARAHLAALAAAHRTVTDAAASAVRHGGAEQVLASYTAAAGEAGLRRLVARADAAQWRALADQVRRTNAPAEAEALHILAVVSSSLREANAACRSGVAAGAVMVSPRRDRTGNVRHPGQTAGPVSTELSEVDDDLAE